MPALEKWFVVGLCCVCFTLGVTGVRADDTGLPDWNIRLNQFWSDDFSRSNGERLNASPGQGIELGLMGRAPSLRVGWSLAYSDGALDRYTNDSGNTFDTNGDLELFELMLNFRRLNDLPKLHQRISSYFGVGIGFRQTTISEIDVSGQIQLDDSSNNLTWYLTHGWMLDTWKQSELTLEYRFSYTGEFNFTNKVTDQEEQWEPNTAHTIGISYAW